MRVQKLLSFLSSNSYEPTKLCSKYEDKIYPENLEIRTSLPLTWALLIGMIVLSIFLMRSVSENENKTFMTLFCLVIIVIPIYTLIDRRPLLTLSHKGIKFKNGHFKKWSEIKDTVIENTEARILVVSFEDSKKKTVSLDDLGYPSEEISHIIEYYKTKTCC